MAKLNLTRGHTSPALQTLPRKNNNRLVAVKNNHTQVFTYWFCRIVSKIRAYNTSLKSITRQPVEENRSVISVQ